MTEELELPQGLMRVLPDDPHQQLDVARKITSMALATRLSTLENRLGRLSQNIQEKDEMIEDIQNRIEDAERAIQRTNIQILKTTDDKIRLAKENELLEGTITKLKQDGSKMESFRKSLVNTLRVDNPHLLESMEDMLQAQVAPAPAKQPKPKFPVLKNDLPRSSRQTPSQSEKLQAEDDFNMQPSVDEGRRRMLMLKARRSRRSTSDFAKVPDFVKAPQPHQYDSGNGLSLIDRIHITDSTSNNNNQRFRNQSLFQYDSDTSISSSPPTISPPKTRSAAGSPPKRISAPNSPLMPRPNVPATAPSSPPRSVAIADGKEFFRQAKSRLSYDQFRALLNNIKDLNSHQQTREDALENARDIFGTENSDLYTFLSQHLPA